MKAKPTILNPPQPVASPHSRPTAPLLARKSGQLARDSSRGSRPTAPSPKQTSGLTAPSLAPLTLIIILAILLPLTAICQNKLSMQVKTFDQSMKPVGNIEISINDSGYFMIGSKGTAMIEVNDSGTKITSVKVKDETIEAASWNVSKGVVEIVIRPRSYRVLQFVLRLPDGKVLSGASITYQGSLTIKSKSDPAGKFVLQLPVKERVKSADQFRVQDFQVTGLTLSDAESILYIARPKPQVLTPVVEVPRQKQPPKQSALEAAKPASGLNMLTLDSISSLASFYSVVRNLPMSSLTVKEKNLLDTKFRALLEKERASRSHAESPREAVAAQGNIPISETSRLDDDINVLLKEAVTENDALQTKRTDFETSAAMLSQKLDTGFVNRSDADRAMLLADIDSLERQFAGNELAFRQSHNDRREIIHALREKYWNIEHANEGVQPQSGLRLIGIAAVIVAIAALVIMLIILYSRLRERTLSLEQAKRKIEQDNENTEDIVKRQTKLLSESNLELNSVLNRSSQELRSVLRSIIGLCKIIEHMPGRELVSRVETATAAMDRVLNKLIDISEIGKDSGNVEQVKLIEVINDVKDKQLSLVADLNSETNSLSDDKVTRPIQFNVNCAADETLFTNRLLLNIVLSNLVENAIHFSTLKDAPGPAVVEIDVVTRGDMTELSVYDNGVGISNAVKSKLFNVSSSGHGLGLYAVRKGVLAMHGKVDIMTEEGVFTRVVVMIPRGQKKLGRAAQAREEVSIEM